MGTTTADRSTDGAGPGVPPGPGWRTQGVQERFARLAILAIAQVLDLIVTGLEATSCRGGEPTWWYPVAGRLTVVAVVWAIVLRLPVGARQSIRLVQAVTVLVAVSIGWSALLLSTC